MQIKAFAIGREYPAILLNERRWTSNAQLKRGQMIRTFAVGVALLLTAPAWAQIVVATL
jgi:hypothetical protein